MFLLLGLLSSGLVDRRHVDDEAELDITFQETVISFVNLVDANDLHLADNVVPAAKVQHLLGLCNTADVRAGEGTATEGEAECRDCQGSFGKSYEHKSTVRLEQIEVCIDVVLCGYTIENEVEGAGV